MARLQSSGSDRYWLAMSGTGRQHQAKSMLLCSTVYGSEVFQRIHVLMKHSHDSNPTGLFHVVQDMAFIRKAE